MRFLILLLFSAVTVAQSGPRVQTSHTTENLRGVSVVSLYPGLVRTEAVLAAAAQGWFTLDNSESPEFLGRVIAALARDSGLAKRSGRVVVAATAAMELGVADVDGSHPVPLALDTV